MSVNKKFGIFIRHVTYIPQMQRTECGAACLAMVLAYHGSQVSLAEVRQACGVTRDGANALAIIQAAHSYGMHAEGAKIELKQLYNIPLPAILHWNFDHFMVLERVNRKKAFLVDPAVGSISLRLEEVSRHFTGIALLFSPTSAFIKKSKKNQSFSKYKEIFKKSIPNLFQVLLASLALQFIGLIFPVANQILLDYVISPQQIQWLWGLAFCLGGAIIGKTVLSLMRSFVIQGLQTVLDYALMSRFIDHLLHLPIGFFLQRDTGDLMQRVQSNTTIRNLIGSQSITALLDGFLLLAYSGLMLAYSLKLGSIVLALAFVRVALLLAYKDRNRQLMASELVASGREGSALVEALTGFETTKASKAEMRMVQRWTHRMTQYMNSSLKRKKIAINMKQTMLLIQGCTTAMVFFIGGQEVVIQQMTMGVFASFLMLQSLFIAPLGTLIETVTQLQYVNNYLNRLDDVLETPREPSGSTDPGRLKGAIELRNVSFSYHSKAPSILTDISISIYPGEKVAIVGPSGAGKSTLARILLGMHLPSTGIVAFDGIDLQEYNLQKLRSQMGVVLQETFLFNDTVRANLSLNNDALPLERLRWAARMACVEQVIERLPGKYAAIIGENGNRLSGGERQRLNLARALAHDPAILLLDEATSALDLETEAKVHANLATLGCTRILIAHRIATVKDADRIIVMNKGHIEQSGTYHELISQKGLFNTLINHKQQQQTVLSEAVYV